jgi:hypothetical protein
LNSITADCTTPYTPHAPHMRAVLVPSLGGGHVGE